jgi:hypothetical protein
MAGTGTATIDFGTTPVAEKSFTVSDASIDTSNYVEAFVQVDSTSDNDVGAHRHAAASWKLVCEAVSGGFNLDITCLMDLCWGTFKIRYVYA